MSSEFLTVLNEVYPRYLQLPPQWSVQEQREHLERESQRLSRMVGDLADQLGEQAVAEWTRSHGRHPDYLTKVGLLTTARLSAREQILNSELYEQIPVESDEDLDVIPAEPVADRDGVPWDRRWTEPDWRTDPSEELEELIERVWPEPSFSMLFRIKAGYLMAARQEDGLAIPMSSDSPLASELATLVYADLRSDGLPER